MKILLTGAAGFTGKHLLQRARAKGHEIIPFDGDLRDPIELRATLSGQPFDSLIHLAGISSPAHTPVEDFYTVNTLGTLHLLEAILSLGKTDIPIILASSAVVYGSTTTSPLEESLPVDPINHYGISKHAMEGIARTFRDRLNILIVRPFNYTGPGQDERFLIPKLVRAFQQKSPTLKLGNLDVAREFNDVAMVCDAYLTLIETQFNSGEILNLCSGQPHALLTVLQTLEALTGYRPKIEVDPALVRPNEIKSLCGCPRKLKAMLGNQVSIEPDLNQTLKTLLEAL